MPQDALDIVHSATIAADQVDYNGHMTEAAYAQIFATAAAGLFQQLDLGADYRARTGCTMYTLETQIRYLQEALIGAAVSIGFRLIGYTQRRLHIYFEMREGERLLATYQCISLHVRQTEGDKPHAAAFDEGQKEMLAGQFALAAHQPLPAAVGQALGLVRENR